MRINRNKQKGKNTIKEKKKTTKIKNLVVAPTGFEPAPQSSSSAKIEALYRWAMRPLHNRSLKINSLVVFFSPIHTVLTLWGCIYHEFKDTCEEKKLKRAFQKELRIISVFIHSRALYRPLDERTGLFPRCSPWSSGRRSSWLASAKWGKVILCWLILSILSTWLRGYKFF